MLRALCVLLFLLVSATQVSADISVFIYHRFGESRYPSTNIQLNVFADQLEYLSAKGYMVLPLSEIARLVRTGAELPEQTVGLCIDDAFTSFAEHALPLLQKYGFPATLFVNTDAVGTNGYLDWDELKDVMTKGVEIGNHTASHLYLVEMEAEETPDLWRNRIRNDIERSKQELKKHLNVAPEIFAYTYGEYSRAVIDIVSEAGFKSAFAQQSGVIYAGSNIWSLPRFPMGGPYATLQGFVRKLGMKALRVNSVEPEDPVIREQNPPDLYLQLADKAFARGQINCFSQAGSTCRVEPDPARKGGVHVSAEEPLMGRRNKYTLTALGSDGRWHWYSHLWINARRPVPIPLN